MMFFLLTGCTHTGKTWLAQQLLATYHIPYLSIDHLKMGLIRSGKIPFTPQEDAGLTEALWPILREICKTVLENRQHLVIEGCDIPFDWRKDFNDVELREIQSCCLLMSADYIKRHFQEIRDYANVIERRLDDSDCTMAL